MAATTEQTQGDKSSPDRQRGKVIERPSRAPLATIRDEVDHVFERFGWPTASWRPFFARDWDPFGDVDTRMRLGGSEIRPSAEVTETDSEWRITVELPGLNEKDIDLTVEDDVVTLKGEKKETREEKKKDYHLTERSYGSFFRRFRMPEDVDSSKVTAKFSKGVLQIDLPKSKETITKQRRIAVKGD